MSSINSSISWAPALGVVLAAGAVFYALSVYVFTDGTARWGYLRYLPVIGIQETWFPWTRATLNSYYLTKQWAFHGYSKVSGFRRTNRIL
jgi:hypothetical protein